MNNLVIPCEIGKVSDGYHTFDELYEHRHVLFLSLMAVRSGSAWLSRLHDDGSSLDGWFVAGIILPTGDISYHLPNRFWDIARRHGVRELEYAPKWDGHKSADVLERLLKWIVM